MKAVLQRVLSASVMVEKELVSSIGQGVLVFAAVAPTDTEKEAESLAAKVLKIKLWENDQAEKWKRNVRDINGEVLCVSQFTLLAKTNKGNKPDFHASASPEHARLIYHHFLQKVADGYSDDRVKDGRFQAMMQVALVNDGPVTLELLAECRSDTSNPARPDRPGRPGKPPAGDDTTDTAAGPAVEPDSNKK